MYLSYVGECILRMRYVAMQKCHPDRIRTHNLMFVMLLLMQKSYPGRIRMHNLMVVMLLSFAEAIRTASGRRLLVLLVYISCTWMHNLHPDRIRTHNLIDVFDVRLQTI